MSRKPIFYIIVLATVLGACNHFSKTESGLRFNFLKRSDKQDLPNIGEYLQCYYSISNSEDSVIYSIFGKTPDRILLTQATHKGGDIMEALSIMAEGDSAEFLISADSFYQITRRESLPDYIKPGTDLKFTIKMDRRLNKFQVDSLINVEKIARWTEEIATINKYVRKKGYQMDLDTNSGIRVQFHQKAASDTAKKIREGSIVKFHFIGKLMDDVEFFNSYTMGQAQTVKVLRTQFQPIGMYEMLLKMKEGEKATFILPYDLAFGAKGVEGMIPPYATLVYELNILKVE